MELLISQEDAYELTESGCHAVEDLVFAKLRRSRKKNKGKRGDRLTWFISHSLEVPACDVNDFFSRFGKESTLTIKEKVNDVVGRTHAQLGARLPGAYATVDLNEVPQVLRDDIHNGVLKQEAAQALMDDMTPGERAEKVNELIGLLRGPGFVEL